LFDNNPATAFTLGLGGTQVAGTGVLSVLIAPTTNLITGGSLRTPGGRRATNGPIDFTEIFLGNNGGGWQKVGKLGNDGSIDTTGGLAGIVLSAVLADEFASFSLTITSGAYNSFRFVDVTPAIGFNRDGFDITAFSLTSDLTLPTPIPSPGTLLLAALGLAGLGVLRRRRVFS
jgi:MYXO-CTERM domain-containing protein